MKRFLVGTTLVLSLLAAQPASAEIVWWNEPPLPYSTPVTFIDTVAGTVQADRLVYWQQIRDGALAEWGIPHVLIIDQTNNFPPFDVNVTEERNGIQDMIRIGRDVTGYCQSYGGWYATVQGGIAIISLCPLWWKNVSGLRGTLAHEIGHAFGLGHSTTGVMSGAMHVSAEERLAVQGYYA